MDKNEWAFPFPARFGLKGLNLLLSKPRLEANSGLPGKIRVITGAGNQQR